MIPDTFRNDVLSYLYQTVPQDYINNMAAALDKVISKYDIDQKETSIIANNDNESLIKCYLASKAISNTSMTTLEGYKNKLEKFFSKINKSYQNITANDIRIYLYYYKNDRKAKDSYVDCIRRNLNTFFDWAKKNGYITDNPCSAVEKTKVSYELKEPLTSYQLEELRYACKDIREKAMIDFFFSTGVRLSEFKDLNKSDINWQNHSAIILHGKGNKSRTVYFNAEAELSLRKYLETRTDKEDALFVTERKPNRRLSKKAIQDIIQKIGERVNIEVHPHKFRHTFATNALKSGVPLENLQVLMGHTKPSTTLIYAKIDEDKLRKEHSMAFCN